LEKEGIVRENRGLWWTMSKAEKEEGISRVKEDRNERSAG
jgi:hypothetical protein